MTEQQPIEPDRASPDFFAAGVPPDFQPVSQSLPYGIDRRLGYPGEARFVSFRYQPATDAIIWNDGFASGVAVGARFIAAEEIAPLPLLDQLRLCGQRQGPHVLLMDRLRRVAYCAEQASADRFLAFQRGLGPGAS
jgi:hypothetical protein